MPISILSTVLKTMTEKLYIKKSGPYGPLFFCLFFRVLRTFKIQNHSMNPSYTLAEAKKKIARYCAYQERCHKEVNDKLREMGMIPAAIDQIISELITNNFLNELRFAEAYARGKFNIKKWGKLRIVSELKQRNVSDYCIKKALKEIPANEYLNTFNELAYKKGLSLRDSSLEIQKRKLMQYLFYRGWESHLIYDKIKELPFSETEA